MVLAHLVKMVNADAKADPARSERKFDGPFVGVSPSGEAGPRDSNGPQAVRFGREILQAWMQYMEDYGAAWLADTGKEFYSQEYWYLVTMTLVRPLATEPIEHQRRLSVHEDRVFKDKGESPEEGHCRTLVHQDQGSDRSSPHPSGAHRSMLLLGRRHFRSSLGGAVRFLREQRLLERNPTALLRQIEGSSKIWTNPISYLGRIFWSATPMIGTRLSKTVSARMSTGCRSSAACGAAGPTTR